MSDLEGSESPEFDALTPGDRLLDGGEEAIDHQLTVPLGHFRPDRIGDSLNKIGFGHSFLLC